MADTCIEPWIQHENVRVSPPCQRALAVSDSKTLCRICRAHTNERRQIDVACSNEVQHGGQQGLHTRPPARYVCEGAVVRPLLGTGMWCMVGRHDIDETLTQGCQQCIAVLCRAHRRRRLKVGTELCRVIR